MAGAPLPPGGTGLPLLGETLTALKNGFAFVEAGARKHGPIFKTNLFFRDTAVITGPEASALFIDSSRVQRAGAMPPHIETLFAGRSLPLLDGEEHRDRKHFVMAGFSREALASYLPIMQKLVSESLGGWSAGGEVRLLDEFKRLAIETIAVTVLGLSRGPTLDAVLADYEVVGGGFSNLPIPLPGTAYTKSQKGAREDPGGVRDLRPGAPGRAEGRRALAHSRGEDRGRPRHLDGRREEGASPRRRRRAHRVGLVRGRRSSSSTSTPKCGSG